MKRDILQPYKKKNTITIECYYSCGSERAQGLWVHDQENRLQAVCEGNPGQVSEDQHEAKPIMHNVHGCQNSLLR